MTNTTKATQMTKTQTFEFLTTLLGEAQFKSKGEQERVLAIINDTFAPKAGGGQTINPSYYDETLQSQMHYCRYLAQYCTQDEIVMSNGKSKGYSKSAIARWTKAGKDAKTLQEKALKLLLNGQQVEGQDLNAQAEELLLKRNKPEFYEDLRN
jgi:hypothetical protein